MHHVWHRCGLDHAEPGLYALLGAAASLAGVTRMTLTLGVILVEVTTDAFALLPMMVALTVAKAVGDVFSHSFDDAMMRLLQLPFLEEEVWNRQAVTGSNRQ